MRRLRRLPFVLLPAALLLAATAAAAPKPTERNYTPAKRPESAIRFIIVHVAEGGFQGTVAWLSDPRSRASAHFVVGRDGEIAQIVRLRDIAWHAGNWAYNVRSVGIEHAGHTDSPAGFTDREYRASARLAAVIARRGAIPIDRRHIFGHDEVPSPNDPLQGGGIDGHSDPGKYWDWDRYLGLVRRFAYPERFLKKKKKHVGIDVLASTLGDRQVIAGEVPWRTRIGGPVKRVSFVVDGKVRWTDNVAPFAFAGGRLWNTFPLKNGPHKLEIRAYGARSWSRHRFVVRVKNEPFTLAPVGLKPKQQVVGVQTVQALFTGVPPARVLLYLDSRQIDHDTSPPYVFKWDTRRVKDGPHTLTLAGRARDGRIVRSQVKVVVANGAVLPAKVVASSLSDGQVVTGTQHWLVETAGTVARVEFLVDGVVRGTAPKAPYAWDWDTTPETPGPHELTVRAVGADGAVAQQTFTVSVGAPSAG